jgi:hypothetical protein
MAKFIGMRTLVLSMFMLLVAGRAEAQACGIPDETPGGVYEAFLELLDEGFPIDDSSACESITKSARSTCLKSVSSSARCWYGLAKGLGKGAKTTCKEQGLAEEPCFAFTGGYLAGLVEGVESSEAEGRLACEVGAGIFFDYCVNGVP